MLLFDQILGPNNVVNMASAAETKLTGTLYNCEKKHLTWEKYVWIDTEKHSVLNGLQDYGYAGIDDSSKVRHLLDGIKTTELDVCNTQVMASPSLRDDFAATLELYSTLIKKMKAEHPQLNVSEVIFARRKAGKILFGKHNSSGISNVSNAVVDDRFFEKHGYHALAPEQKNTLRLKRLKRGHVGKCHGGNGNGTGRSSGRGPTIKYLVHSITALTTKIDKFRLPDDDDDDDEDEYPEEEEGTFNRSNAALTHQIKNKKRGVNWLTR
jgi:hypothetical protein